MSTADLERDLASLLDAGDHDAAASLAIRGYGPQILGYLHVVLRDDTAAHDAFAQFCEDLWTGLPTFRRAASVRVWAYKIAWHAALRIRRDPYHRRGRPIGSEQVSRMAAEVRSQTAPHLRTEVKDRMAALRASLTPEEQALLTLRIDRELPWSEVAEILEEPEPALRKRFERVKLRLRELAREQGLLPGGDEG